MSFYFRLAHIFLMASLIQNYVNSLQTIQNPFVYGYNGLNNRMEDASIQVISFIFCRQIAHISAVDFSQDEVIYNTLFSNHTFLLLSMTISGVPRKKISEGLTWETIFCLSPIFFENFPKF
jgi:hypothetical protein